MLIVWMIYQFSIYKITFEWEWGIEQATLFSHFIYDRHVRVRQTPGWGHFHCRCMLHPLRLYIPKDLGRVFMKILKMKNLKVLIGIKKKVSFIYYSLSFFLYFGFQQTPSATGKWGRGWANGDRTPNSKSTNPLSHKSKELSLVLLSLFHNNSYLKLWYSG